MNPVASGFLLIGGLLAVIAGVGMLRFGTPYARFHAAGKASPIAFLVVAIGSAIELGATEAARLAVVAGALILTLPLGVHLLFRAVHKTDLSTRPPIDELAADLVDRPEDH